MRDPASRACGIHVHLEERTKLTSSEQFIELAASESSLSGDAYRVRCAGRAEQTSAAWFLEQLRAIRANPSGE